MKIVHVLLLIAIILLASMVVIRYSMPVFAEVVDEFKDKIQIQIPQEGEQTTTTTTTTWPVTTVGPTVTIPTTTTSPPREIEVSGHIITQLLDSKGNVVIERKTPLAIYGSTEVKKFKIKAKISCDQADLVNVQVLGLYMSEHFNKTFYMRQKNFKPGREVIFEGDIPYYEVLGVKEYKTVLRFSILIRVYKGVNTSNPYENRYRVVYSRYVFPEFELKEKGVEIRPTLVVYCKGGGGLEIEDIELIKLDKEKAVVKVKVKRVENEWVKENYVFKSGIWV